MRAAFQVAGLTLMIRATRGRSRRPNHMPSQIGGPKAMRPVSLRRLPGELHSVAKQGSFETPFFGVPGQLWSDFGRFGEANKEVKMHFGENFS